MYKCMFLIIAAEKRINLEKKNLPQNLFLETIKTLTMQNEKNFTICGKFLSFNGEEVKRHLWII